MARYRLVGGPCDGQQSQNFTVKPFAGYQILCQTHQYEFRADNKFHDLGLASVLVPSVLGTAGPKGWADLQHAVNRNLPHALRDSQQTRRAAVTRLMQRRRVR